VGAYPDNLAAINAIDSKKDYGWVPMAAWASNLLPEKPQNPLKPIENEMVLPNAGYFRILRRSRS